MFSVPKKRAFDTLDSPTFLWFIFCMKSLVIHANAKSARNGAFAIGLITVFLFMGGLIVAVSQDVDWGGPLTWFSSIIIFGWLFLSLGNASFWLFQLSRFKGPLVTIGTEGIIDHFNNDNFLRWAEICLIDWKSVNHKGIGVVLFRVIPIKRSIKYTMLSIFGRGRLQYPAQYLSVQASEITQFLLHTAPKNILK